MGDMAQGVLAHQPLINFLEEEADRRHLTLGELAEAMQLNPSQLYNIRNGKQPGLRVCITIARHTKMRVEYILFLAGQISFKDMDGQEHLTAREQRVLNLLASLKDTPYYEMALREIEGLLDIIMFKADSE